MAARLVTVRQIVMNAIGSLAVMMVAVLSLVAVDVWEEDVAFGAFFLGGFGCLAIGLAVFDLVAFHLPIGRVSSRVWTTITGAILVMTPVLLAANHINGEIGGTLLVPALVIAGIGVVVALAWYFGASRLSFLFDHRFSFASAVSATLIMALFIALHRLEGTFLETKTDTVRLHLIFFVGTWIGSLVLCLPWAFRIVSASPPNLRPKHLAVLTGTLLVMGGFLAAVDRKYLIGLYPYAHMWLQVLALGTIAVGIRPWISVLTHTQQSVWRKVTTILCIGSATVLLAGVVFFVIGADYMNDPYFRAGVSKSSTGSTLLELRHTQRHASRQTARRRYHDFLDVELRHGDVASANDWNILFITIDAMRGDILPRKGAGLEKWAPHLAKLTENCSDFTRTYAPGSRTALSMGALNLGRYSTNIKWVPLIWLSRRLFDPRTTDLRELKKFKGRSLAFTTVPETPLRGTIPMRLKDAGFHTMGTMYAGNNQNFKPGKGFNRGFDDYIDLSGTLKVLAPTSDQISDAAIKQIRKAGKKRWFQWVHYYSTHWSDGDRPRYLELLKEVDTAVGTLLAELDLRNIRRNTAILISADHGEGMKEENKGGHATSVDDVQTRVPLLVCIPGGQAKTFTKQATSGLDAMATILAIAHADSRDVDGLNLLPFITGDETMPIRSVFTELHRFVSKEGKKTVDLKAIIRGRWKLIQDRLRNTIELYDMQVDPNETRNVASKRKDVTYRLHEALNVYSHNGEIEFGLSDYSKLAKKVRKAME